MGDNIISSLEKNYNVLAVCKCLNPEKSVMGSYRSLLKKYKKVCIVTTNRLSSALMDIFRENKIDYSGCFFIDCVSSKMMRAVSTKQVYYLVSPHALTELSLKFSSILDEFDLIIFDNLDGLLLYSSEVFVLRFLNSVTSRIRQKKIRAVYWAMGAGKERLIGDVSFFVDSVVEVK